MSLQQIPGHYIVSASSTGGGGDTPTALVNTGASAWVSGVVTGDYTAEQIAQKSWVQFNLDTSNPYDSVKYASGPWSSLSGCVGYQLQGTSAYSTLSAGSTGTISAVSASGSYWPRLTKTVTWTDSSETSVYGTSNAEWTDSSYFAGLSPDQEVVILIESYKVASQATAVTGVAIDDGNGSLPYPDRPKIGYGSSAASASAYQWQASNGYGTKYIDENGSESAGTTVYATPEKLWEVNSAAQVSSIPNAISSYYPSTAYAISVGNVQPTASASGNWW